MFQCPGCLEYIHIISKRVDSKATAYEVDNIKKKHKCNQLKELQKWVQSLSIDIEELDDYFDTNLIYKIRVEED